MLKLNHSQVDNNRVDIVNTKYPLCMIVMATTRYFAENYLETQNKLQWNNKVCPKPKIFLIDSNQQWIYGIDLINKMRKNADLKSIVVYTAKDNNRNKSDVLNLNIAGYMYKPTDSYKSYDLLNPVQLLDCY